MHLYCSLTSYLCLYPQILQNQVLVELLLSHGRALDVSRTTAADALRAAVVQRCSRAAVVALHSSVFPPKLPVAIGTHSLLPKGFASNKIMYLTTQRPNVIPFSEKQQSRRLLSLFLFADHAILGLLGQVFDVLPECRRFYCIANVFSSGSSKLFISKVQI